MPPTELELFHDVLLRRAPDAIAQRNLVSRDIRVSTSLHQVFDVYIPNALREMGATKVFIERVTSMVPGATVSRAAEGQWQGIREPVQVLRISVELVDCQGQERSTRDKLRAIIRNAAVELLRDLCAVHGHVEHAIFFNDWTTHGTLIEHVQETNNEAESRAS